MIPSTPEELRERVRGWRVADLHVAVAAGLGADPLDDVRLRVLPCLSQVLFGMSSA